MEELIAWLKVLDWEHLIAVGAAAAAAWWARHGWQAGRVMNGNGKKEPGLPVILAEIKLLSDRVEANSSKIAELQVEVLKQGSSVWKKLFS